MVLLSYKTKDNLYVCLACADIETALIRVETKKLENYSIRKCNRPESVCI